MLLAAIDPGLRACGLAVYDCGDLVFGCLVRNPELVLRGHRAWAPMVIAVLEAFPLYADRLVVELPQYDGRTGQNGVAADVFEVVGVAGTLLAAFAGRVGWAKAVTPGQWAGMVPKDVRQERLMEVLTDEDLEQLETLDHNVLDAVDLARWAFGGALWGT